MKTGKTPLSNFPWLFNSPRTVCPCYIEIRHSLTNILFLILTIDNIFYIEPITLRKSFDNELWKPLVPYRVLDFSNLLCILTDLEYIISKQRILKFLDISLSRIWKSPLVSKFAARLLEQGCILPPLISECQSISINII